MFRTCNRRGADEDGKKKRNVRDEVPKEGRRQTIICLLPCFKLDLAQLESLVFFHIIEQSSQYVFCVFRTCNRRGADEDGKKKRNVREEVPKEVGGKLASVYCHVSNLILPFLIIGVLSYHEQSSQYAYCVFIA